MSLDILEICESLGIFHYPLNVESYYDEEEDIELSDLEIRKIEDVDPEKEKFKD